MQRLTVHFKGHVQNVGFRAAAREVVSKFDVTGYVRNCEDGQVMLVLEGDSADIASAADAVHKRMAQFIRSTTRNASLATNEFERFEIRH